MYNILCNCILSPIVIKYLVIIINNFKLIKINYK